MNAGNKEPVRRRDAAHGALVTGNEAFINNYGQ